MWHPIHGGSRNTLSWFVLYTETGISFGLMGDLTCKQTSPCTLYLSCSYLDNCHIVLKLVALLLK